MSYPETNFPFLVVGKLVRPSLTRSAWTISWTMPSTDVPSSKTISGTGIPSCFRKKNPVQSFRCGTVEITNEHPSARRSNSSSVKCSAMILRMRFASFVGAITAILPSAFLFRPLMEIGTEYIGAFGVSTPSMSQHVGSSHQSEISSRVTRDGMTFWRAWDVMSLPTC